MPPMSRRTFATVTTVRRLPAPAAGWRLLGSCAVAALPLLVVACGGGDNAQATGTSSGATSDDPLLDAALGGRSPAEVELEMQNAVQQCMTGLGWEYTVVTSDASLGGDLAAGAGDGADEFAEQFGYGISIELDPALIGAGGGAAAPTDDPNIAYAESLPPDQQEAYYKDLFGATFGSSGAGDDNAEAELGGCMGEASRAALGDGSLEQLTEQFERVDELVRADPRVIDAVKAWAACMSAKGYSYAAPEDPMSDFSERLAALGDSPAKADLEALQVEELAAAKADRACVKEAKVDEIGQQAYADAAAKVAGQ